MSTDPRSSNGSKPPLPPGARIPDAPPLEPQTAAIQPDDSRPPPTDHYDGGGDDVSSESPAQGQDEGHELSAADGIAQSRAIRGVGFLPLGEGHGHEEAPVPILGRRSDEEEVRRLAAEANANANANASANSGPRSRSRRRPTREEVLLDARLKWPKGSDFDLSVYADWVSGSTGVSNRDGSEALARLKASDRLPEQIGPVASPPPAPALEPTPEILPPDQADPADAAPQASVEAAPEPLSVYEWMSLVHTVMEVHDGHPNQPHSRESAESWVTGNFTHATPVLRELLIRVLMNDRYYRADDGKDYEITAEILQGWVNEARQIEADVAWRQSLKKELLAAVPTPVPFQKSWLFRVVALFAVLAIAAAGFVFLSSQAEERSYQAALDKAASKEHILTDDGATLNVENFDDLLAKTGLSKDRATREVQQIGTVAHLDHRLKKLENKDIAEAKRADREAKRANDAVQLQSSAELAFSQIEEARKQDRNDYDLRKKESDALLKAAQKLVGVQSGEIEGYRAAVVERIRAGRCGEPLDERYPNDAGSGRAHYTCGASELYVCDGRLPSEATNCRFVKP